VELQNRTAPFICVLCDEVGSANDEQVVSGGIRVSEELHHARSLGLSVALGAAMGAALGAATGHIGVWVAAGIAAYIVISLVGGVWNKKPNDQRRSINGLKHND
jgi:hypothetical protein